MNFIFLGGGDDERRLFGCFCCCLLALSPLDAAATTELLRPAVCALAAAARGWRAAIGKKLREEKEEKERAK